MKVCINYMYVMHNKRNILLGTPLLNLQTLIRDFDIVDIVSIVFVRLMLAGRVALRWAFGATNPVSIAELALVHSKDPTDQTDPILLA
jgi:hypothetical protein